MASSVTTNRYSICTECIGYHLGIVTVIGTDKDDAMSTASDPHLVSEHPYHYLLSARSRLMRCSACSCTAAARSMRTDPDRPRWLRPLY